MRKIAIVAIAAVAIAGGIAAFFATRGVAEVDFVQKFQDGEINWTKGVIEVIGNAAAPSNVPNPGAAKLTARRGAIVDAERRLLEIIEGIRLLGKTTMVNYEPNDILWGKVQGLVRGAEIVPGSEEWNVDERIYRLKMRMDFNNLCSFFFDDIYRDRFRPTGELKPARYTGLIIDARGIPLTPQVMFRIVDTEGNLVYGAAKAYYQVAIYYGLVKYNRALKAAMKDPRVGPNPLVVKAVDAGGDFNTDVIVSVTDGNLILRELDATDVFANAKVIVVVD